MIFKISLTKSCEKQLKKVPKHVLFKLETWTRSIELHGIETVRKISGYHDEALKGERKGQRSVRLSKAWRAIYVIRSTTIEFVEIQEVNHHDY